MRRYSVSFKPGKMLFRDWFEAGEKLAGKLIKYKGEEVVVLGIPRGGVPVAYPIAKKLGAVLDVVIPRKLPIPWSPEVGFGAVTSAGDIVLNERIINEIDLTRKEINAIAQKVKEEIERRMKVYRGNKPMPDLKDKVVVVVDDGFATGYTMIAALQSIRRQQPKKIIAAAPVSPLDSVERIKPYADEVVTLWAKPAYSFAVAQFYEDFHDMADGEVRELLKEF